METALKNVVDYYHPGAGKSSPNAAIGFLAAFWDLRHLALHGNSAYTL
jgi:hypothetical protein